MRAIFHACANLFPVCFAKFIRIYSRLTFCVILIHVGHRVNYIPFTGYLGSKRAWISHLGWSWPPYFENTYWYYISSMLNLIRKRGWKCLLVALSLSGVAHQLANLEFMLYYALYPYIYHAKIIYIIYLYTYIYIYIYIYILYICIYVHAFIFICTNIYEYM